MSRFNTTKPTGTTNLAGGKAYKESNEMQLVSLLLTSFGNDKFYEKSGDIFKRLDDLITSCDKLFCAKAIVYARTVFGMRTITHYASSVLAKHIGGEAWAKDFYSKVVWRPDDMTEIIACHLGRKEKITNAMKKGFAKAFGDFDEYQLAKYKGEGKEVKLVDVVNLVHPVQTEKNGSAIGKLINGELKSHDTWESELSAVGSDTEAKKAVWNRLLDERKLGYFALLRNLRNIISLGDESLKTKALNALVDRNAIKKSMVLPFRFATAYDELSKIDTDAMRAISKACEIACDNVPKFGGKTLVALDVSGSMSSNRVADIASLFTAVLLKSNNCDLIVFSDNAKYAMVNPDDSVMTISKAIRYACGGTNFPSVFKTANKKYDRVILLSDMQSWIQNSYWIASPKAAFEEYKRTYGANDCKFYSFDLAGYGTMQMPENDVFLLAGFSDKIFDLMSYLETDKKAIFKAIDEISLK